MEMARYTITEALAELKTLNERINKKHMFLLQKLTRPKVMIDPLSAQGGSEAIVASERQSIADLELRIILLRRGVHDANAKALLTIGNFTWSIADWLVWKNEVAKHQIQRYEQMYQQIQSSRKQARDAMAKQGATMEQIKEMEPIVHVDEQKLQADIEAITKTLSTLDGKLSLANATTVVEIAQ